MKFKELVAEYRDGSSARRSEIVANTLAGLKMQHMRNLVRRAYRDTDLMVVMDGHSDFAYLRKLLGWAVVERSGVLDDEHLQILIRHRAAHITKGPNLKAYPDASGLDLDIEEGSDMETQKKAKAEKKTTEPKAAKERKSNGLAPETMLVLKTDAAKLRGLHAACSVFSTPHSVKAGLAHFEKLFEAKKLKSSRAPEKAFRDTVKWMIANGDLKVSGGEAPKAAKKPAKKEPDAETEPKSDEEAA